MKETILDVLMYMFQSYVEDNEEVELDKESLHKNLLEAGFADQNIEKAFEWLEGLPGVDHSTLLNKPTKNSFLKSKQVFPSTRILSVLVFTKTFSMSDRFESL